MSSNSFPKRAGRSRFARRPLALLLALVLLAALLPKLETATEAAYYDEAIQKLIGWDVLRGYPDGSLHADSYITRAEFVALINRAYGYGDTATIPFNDVPDNAWYHGDISAAYAAGYFTGTSPVTAEPSGELTREQAMVLLARNMRLDEGAGEVTSFSDGRSFHSYSAGYANTAVTKGLVSGYSDGSFRPENSITRGEMAVMLSRALGNLVNSEGTYALGDVFGNVTVNSPNVTLRNTTIAGDLYLTGGLGLGGVTLENVRVLGDIIVAGGGESDEGESVILRNVTADNIRVDTLLGEYVSLRAEGDTNIGEALLISDAYLQDRTASGLGFQTIRMEGEGGQFSLSGNLEKVVNAAPYSLLRVSQGTVQDLTMDEAAVGASLWLDSSATVHNLTLDTATAVEGRGDVRKLNVNVAGTNTEMLPDEIEIRPGLTGVVSGENMDSTAAAEASSEPRLLANYPRMINVSATSATATFSTNKSGTIYWAVTSISDGSVNEEALLVPAARSSILKSGNLTAAQSNTVYSANITGLTSGGNYYLTAMLRDARGDYSPIKVASFTTTDNTTPAFGSGHPYMSEISDTYAWATVMATKDCQLYWVVFDRGSSAPTVASFRAGAFSNSYGYGVMDMQRNISQTFPINNLKNLEELKSYDVYFWLNDANSAKSSAVRKLSFTTVDKTPPKFNTEPTVTNIAATSLRLTTNVNEAGTVYWVIVEGGEDYPKQPTTSILERDPNKGKQEVYDEYFKLQIANGMNGLKAGSVRVRANVDATINITGLQAETQYKIYYLAKDNAGNYSEIKLLNEKSETTGETYYVLNSNYIWQSTLDLNAPTVDQEFTRGSAPRPYADTSIRIVFSERVQYHDPADNAYYKPLDEAYEAYREFKKSANPTEAQRRDAQEYLDILHKIIKLYSSDGNLVSERSDANPHIEDGVEDYDWVIDYRNATVTTSGRNMIVTFPTVINETTERPTSESALNLNSDATYHFTIDCIADTASNPNDMNDRRPVELEPFTTIAAQVNLKGENLSPRQITVDGAVQPVDTIYSMTPVSVSRADPAKSWDMLIWADKEITFDLYAVETLDNEPMPTTGWKKVGAVPGGTSKNQIVIDARYKGEYIGLSYWRDLKGAGYNPYFRNDANTASQQEDGYYGLEDGKVYYFAIKLTRIENTDPDNWTGSVNFWITVNTGDDESFEAFEYGGDMTEERYGIVTEIEKKLSEISKSADGSERFIRTVSFADKEAPEFVNGYPKLEVTDTGLKASLQLERAGTIYWVVAPVEGDGKINTTRRYYSYVESYGEQQAPNPPVDYQPNSTVEFDQYDVPIGDGAYHESSTVSFYDRQGGTLLNPDGDWYPLYLSSPTTSDVYGPNPSFVSNGLIKTGYIEANNVNVTPLEVSGLASNTEYFLYIVIKGTSTVYSDHVQLFQFKTAEAYRPGIEVMRDGTTGVSVRSHNMDAAVDYALFQSDLLYRSPTLNANFADPAVMGAENYAQYKRDYPDGTNDPIAGLKVYEAMLSGPTGSYDSYFDKYADASYKLQVRDIVTSSAGGNAAEAYIGGTAGTPKSLEEFEKRQQMLGIDCDKEFTLKDGVNYYILTVSRYANADPAQLTGNSYSFRAYQPIYKMNTDPPKLTSITGTVYVDYTAEGATSANPKISGIFQMYFDNELYYYRRNDDRTPIHQYSTDSDTHKSVSVLSSAGYGINIVTDGTENQTIDRITLEMAQGTAQVNTDITFDGGAIASAYSQPIGEINLSVNLNASDSGSNTHLADTTITYDGQEHVTDIWQNGIENIRINVVVTSTAPKVTSVSLNMASPPYLTGQGQQAEITATVRFNSPSTSHEVVWTSSDENVVSVLPRRTVYPGNDATPNGGGVYTHTAKVTAISSGSATITASCGGVTSESITINVNIPTPASFRESDYQIKVGDTLDLKQEMTLSPEEVRDLSIEWSSDNSTVASVSGFIEGKNEGGVVNANTPGKATISAKITPASGKQTTLTATVTVSR